MVWTAPITAIPEQVFTAAQWNTYIRDNLLATARGQDETTAGALFVSDDENSLVARVCERDLIAGPESTSDTSYTDLATPGPAVTIETGERALIIIRTRLLGSNEDSGFASFEITGDSSASPSDVWGIAATAADSTTTVGASLSSIQLIDDLTPGTSTFTMKYRMYAGGVASQITFDWREIIAIGL